MASELVVGEVNYTVCSRCGATTITLFHWITGSNIEVNPLPAAEGTVEPNFWTGTCRVVPQKYIKKHGNLWLAHVATCPALTDLRRA